MTLKIKQFGPEQLLSAPRRTPAYPSPSGTSFVFSQSIYSFESHARTSEIVVCDLATGKQTTVSKDVKASEPQWLGDGNLLVWLKEGENGNTSIIIAEATASGATYTAGTVSGPVSTLKLHVVETGTIAIAVAGSTNADGSLHNPKDTSKSLTTAKVYDATFVRHWNSYVTKERNSIFTGVLKQAPARVQGRKGRYSLIGFTNALKGTGLECPIPPFGGSDHFDIGRRGLIFVSKDPDLNPATHTKCNAYLLLMEQLMPLSEPKPFKIALPGFEGAATSPVWAEDNRFAFLQMRQDGYESDQNLIIFGFVGSSVDSDMDNDAQDLEPVVSEVLSDIAAPQVDESGIAWSLSPSALTWSPDGYFLYAQAERHGAVCLFAIPAPSRVPMQIRQLTHTNSVIEVVPIPKSPNLLLSSSSLVDSSIYSLLNPYAVKPPPPQRPPVPIDHALTSLTISPPTQEVLASTAQLSSILNSSTALPTKFGLSPKQVSSFWFKGDNDHPVHALMVRPSTFNADKKYPLAFFVHGGPQGAWNDAWSTRWNPAVFAEQGYVVIAPNPTGSTGYGQAFVDAIRENWGGSPYIDLEKCIAHISATFAFVDMSRAIALGASYGGYMMNWIQGHALAAKFIALVCHDGVFSMTGQLASEEQYFPVHDMGGSIWEKPEIYQKWDPARPDLLAKWKTPMLVIHNDLDYRLTIAEGLSAFNVLQGKGVESRFLTFSDEGHWVVNPENSLVWHLVVLNWCNKFAGLPEVRDSQGRNGDEFVRQSRRKVGSGK